MRNRFLAVLILATSVVTQSAETQVAKQDRHPVENSVCFRGSPRPYCGAFWLTEFSAIWLLGQQFVHDGDGQVFAAGGSNSFLLISELGWMLNVSQHDAMGVTMFAEVGYDDVAAGMNARYRRWLSRRASLDVAIGTPMFGYGAYDRLVTRVKLNYGDLIGGLVHVDVGEHGLEWGLGAEVGAGLGVVANLLELAALVVVVATYDFM